jgi:glycosyltransferase involved in cell wall biosynthesis
MKQKILIINPFTGKIGPNTFLNKLFENESKNEFIFDFLIPKKDECNSYLKKSNHTILSKNLELKNISNVLLKYFKRIINEIYLCIYFIKNKKKLLKYDKIIINTELFFFFPLFFPKKIEIFIIVHSLSFKDNILSGFIFLVQNSFVKKYIAVSNEVRNFLRKKGVTKPIDVFYIGVDANNYIKKNNNDSKEIINVISVIHPFYHKGAHILIDVIRKTLENNKNIFFTIVGWQQKSGSINKYATEVEDKIRKLNLNTNIKIISNTNDIIEYYKNADLMVHPSLNESFGIVLLEAMSFGIPVICFKIGGMKEIVKNNSTGFLITPYDIDMMVSSILVLQERKKRELFGINSIEVVKNNFNIKNCYENFINIII